MDNKSDLHPDELKTAFERLASGAASTADRQLIEQALFTERIVVASSERSVAVGGDVIDSVIVTGDVTGALLIFKGTDAAAIHDAVQTIATRPRELSSADRADLDRAYLTEVIQKYEFWRDHYTPLAAVARLRAERVGVPTVAPREFLPRGFDVLLRENFKPAREPREEPKTEHFDDLRDAIEKHGDLVLLGEPGAGKTTTLWRLMFDYAQRGLTPHQAAQSPIRLPVLISLGRYDSNTPILDFVRTELVLASKSEAKVYPAHRRLAAHLEEYLEDGQLVLLFDELNEMPQKGYTDSIRRLERFGDQQRGNHFIFTCRALDYTTKLAVPEATIQELDEDAQHNFLSTYFTDVGERLFDILRDEHKVLLEVGRNPYMLLMIGQVSQLNGKLPPNRGLLSQSFVSALIERKRKSHPDRWLDAEIQIQVVSDLAFAIQREHGRGTSVPREWANKYITGSVRVNGRDVTYDPSDLLYLARSASLLDESADGSLCFTHQLIQEYFAAVALLCREMPEIADYARYYAWDEVLVLLAGLMEEATQFIEKVMEVDPFLAARCTGTALMVSPLTVDQVTENLGRKLVEGSVYESVRSIRGLSTIKTNESMQYLLPCLRSKYRNVWKEARNSLREFSSQMLIPDIKPYLKDRDYGIRLLALEISSSVSIDSAFPYIKEMLNSPLWFWRMQSADLLIYLKSEIFIPYLLSLIRTHSGTFGTFRYVGSGLSSGDSVADNRILQMAAIALGRIRSDLVLPELLQLLRSRNADRRTAATLALASLGAPKTIPYIIPMLTDKDSNVREAATIALGNISADSNAEYFQALLKDKDSGVRQAAIQGLSNLKLENLIALILPLTRDRAPSVRQVAIKTLGKLRAQPAVPQLLQLLKKNAWMRKNLLGKVVRAFISNSSTLAFLDEPPSVRARVVEALAAIDHNVVIPIMPALIADEDSDVRRSAAEAASKLKIDTAIPLLISLLKDKDWGVRDAALFSLQAMATEEHLAFFASCLSDDNSIIRYSASEIIESIKRRLNLPKDYQIPTKSASDGQ
ncbi:MAG: HEAT repeat domain-containing protein [Anaerolineae bacterium]|nr:HEAT repeat domain-containing protein [Anaerolineae bacterium]